MKTLYSLMNDELAKLYHMGYCKYDKLDSFITSDKESAEFIKSLNRDVNEQFFSQIEIAQGRARHSAITYLTGLVFQNFGNLFEKIETQLGLSHAEGEYLWRLTSLNHDIGYFSDYIKRGDLVYQKVFKYYLFSPDVRAYIDSPKLKHIAAYSSEEILNYDKYAREYHAKSKGDEKIDHGILGGIRLYDVLCRQWRTNLVEADQKFYYTLLCSLTIAQHNIFKSENEETDVRYSYYNLNRLLSTSKFSIDADSPLLLFLSLIDTIECVKKLSKKENSSNFLHTKTVLTSVEIDVSNSQIHIDFSKLYEEVKGNTQKLQNYNSIFHNIVGLSKWTTFQTKADINSEKIEIEFKSERSNFLPKKEIAMRY